MIDSDEFSKQCETEAFLKLNSCFSIEFARSKKTSRRFLNDQNASPTNQKTAGSKLERTSELMFYGSWRYLESFSGGFLVRICLLGCLLRHLVKSLLFNGTAFE